MVERATDLIFSREQVLYDPRRVREPSQFKKDASYEEKDSGGKTLRRFRFFGRDPSDSHLVEKLMGESASLFVGGPNWILISLVEGGKEVPTVASMADIGVAPYHCTGAYHSKRYVVPAA
ncbi:MAG: hypothetical protein WC494_02365 [Candidatus Pacearchaeota archaeon]